MKINIIVAADPPRVIGIDNKIPWHLAEDLHYFRQVTTGHLIIMGRKTWDSLPKKPLPNRLNIVVSRQPYQDLKLPAGAIHAESLQGAITYAKFCGVEEVFIIGGAHIYRQALPLAHRVYLTQVLHSVPDSVPGHRSYFPALPEEDWELTSNKAYIKCQYQVFDRKLRGK